MSEEKNSWNIQLNIGGNVGGQVGVGETVNQQQTNQSASANNDALPAISPEKQAQLNRLRQTMRAAFIEADVQDLCFTLGIRYEDLPNPGLSNKIRDLIDLMARQNKLDELIALCKQQRPSMAW